MKNFCAASRSQTRKGTWLTRITPPIALGGARRAFVQADLSALLLGASFEVVVVGMFRRFRVVPMMRRCFFGRLHHVVKRWLIMVISDVFPLPILPLTRPGVRQLWVPWTLSRAAKAKL